MDVNETLVSLVELYGSGDDLKAPRQEQWRKVLERAPGAPLTLVNLFKFATEAVYGDGVDDTKVSGEEAFARYAAVSLPAMREAGGEFLAVGPYAGNFLGEDQDWDFIAIGRYPTLDAFLRLYENPTYIEAFKHRKAAISKQSVFVLDA